MSVFIVWYLDVSIGELDVISVILLIFCNYLEASVRILWIINKIWEINKVFLFFFKVEICYCWFHISFIVLLVLHPLLL